MLCQKCKKVPATTRYVKTINGYTQEINLCETCAADEDGIFGGMMNFGAGLDNILASFLTPPPAQAARRRAACSQCGWTLADLTSTGRLGCADCYTFFSAELAPYIAKLHGNARHVGRVPASAGPGLASRKRLAELEKKLALAVEKQEFEQAAGYRDAIAELRGEGGLSE